MVSDLYILVQLIRQEICVFYSFLYIYYLVTQAIKHVDLSKHVFKLR